MQITGVQGHLKESLPFWKDVHAPYHILECIESGYRLSLKFIPLPHTQHNHHSVESHQSFVDEAIGNSKKNHCVIRVDEQLHVFLLYLML